MRTRRLWRLAVMAAALAGAAGGARAQEVGAPSAHGGVAQGMSAQGMSAQGMSAQGTGAHGAEAPKPAAQGSQAPAPPEETDCASAAWSLERERADLAAPDLPRIAAGRRLDPRQGAVELVLLPRPAVVFVHPPERPAIDPDRFGGTFVVPIARGGLWQVTLSDQAWVDVVADGRLVPPTAFTGVHHCPGVRKSVRFALGPGLVILQLSEAPSARLRVVIAPFD